MIPEDAVRRFGQDVRAARRAAGLTQCHLASRARISQPMISRIERGVISADLGSMARLARGLGHDLSVRLYPRDGIRLRDSGQLALAEVIRAAAHPMWRVSLEMPVAPAPDRRAADMVLASANAVLLIEIERGLRDLQAQLRAAQLKRVALADRLGRRVTLVLAVPDSAAARQAVAPHLAVLRIATPVTSRAAWTAIRAGTSIEADALLWVRADARRTQSSGA